MKLITSKGELTLPVDFSFEIEQNSAFFSDNGTASIGATIPSTPADQAKLGYPCRIARKNMFVNAFPARVVQGVFQKRGVLVVANATNKSITCSIALEDSEFYAQNKTRKLRDIFAGTSLSFSTPLAAYQWLYGVYSGTEQSDDLRVVPVAVDYDAESDSYQVNNKPVTPSGIHTGVYELEHEPRPVGSGDSVVSVPEGYGIAPFLTLSALFEQMFSLLGYELRGNVFATAGPLSNLILMHNCADVICNGNIKYSDLLPDVTVGDLIDWIGQKFHAQIAVHPESALVDIILMEDVLSSQADMDVSHKITGRPQYSYSGKSRVVLQPDTSLEGAQPAAATLSDFIRKQVSYFQFNEAQFETADRNTVVQRLSTGDFYKVLADGTKVRLGSSYFAYDRANADGAQVFSPSDIMPPMVYVDGVLMPYIGARIHRNTTLDGKEEKGTQGIIIADYAGLSTDGTYNYATTSKYDDAGVIREGAHDMNAEDYYFLFWKRFGDILLNNSISIQGGCDLSIAEINSFNLYALKLYKGQTLLPRQMKYQVGNHIRCQSLTFLLVKNFSDSGGDQPIVPPVQLYRWQLNNTDLEAFREDWARMFHHYEESWDPQDKYQVDYPEISLAPPTYIGQTSDFFQRLVDCVGYDEDGEVVAELSEFVYQWYEAVSV